MKKMLVVFILILNILISTNISAQERKLDGAILVVNKTRSSVSVIFTDTSKAQITIPTDEGPSEIVISPDRKLAVVSNYGYFDRGSSLTFIDLESFTWIGNFDFGQEVRPHGLAFLPESNLLLVTLESRNSVVILDAVAGKVLHEIGLETESLDPEKQHQDSTKPDEEIELIQTKPRLIAVHPSGKSAYVTNEVSGNVSVLDLNNFTLAENIHIGDGIEGIDVSPSGHEVWVANKIENLIYVIETTEHKIKETLPSPFFPTRLKFTPDGRHLFILNTKSGHLTIVKARTKIDELYLVPEDKVEMYLSTEDFEKALEIKYKLTIIGKKFIASSRTEGDLNLRAEELNKGGESCPR